MKRVTCLAALLSALVLSAEARASDPIGSYAIVEKVVLEPQGDAPERVQIWGTFAMAKEAGGWVYDHPLPGYLYYKAAPGKEDVCRKEWSDMKKVAGTGQIIAFGSSYHPEVMGKVRKASEEPKSPDLYPLGVGLTKINLARTRGSGNYPPLKELSTLPTPLTPGDGDLVPAGEVTLVVRNIIQKRPTPVKYHFELEDASGDKEVSQAVDAGVKETKWSPSKPLKAGAKYTWRVWATDRDWKGPVASSTIQVKG